MCGFVFKNKIIICGFILEHNYGLGRDDVSVYRQFLSKFINVFKCA